jgi:hypothetical protein
MGVSSFRDLIGSARRVRLRPCGGVPAPCGTVRGTVREKTEPALRPVGMAAGALAGEVRLAQRPGALLTGALEYRTLRYVWLVNASGHLLTLEQLNAYTDGPESKSSPGAFAAAAALASAWTSRVYSETVGDCLLRLEWIEFVGSTEFVRVTPLGRAVCRAVEARREEEAGGGGPCPRCG